MSTNNRNSRSKKDGTSLRHISRKGARVVKKSVVTLGDLISAACDVSGSADAAAVLLSPLSPLSKMLGRRIVAV